MKKTWPNVEMTQVQWCSHTIRAGQHGAEITSLYFHAEKWHTTFISDFFYNRGLMFSRVLKLHFKSRYTGRRFCVVAPKQLTLSIFLMHKIYMLKTINNDTITKNSAGRGQSWRIWEYGDSIQGRGWLLGFLRTAGLEWQLWKGWELREKKNLRVLGSVVATQHCGYQLT